MLVRELNCGLQHGADLILLFFPVPFIEVNLASAGISVILICGWNRNVRPAYEIPTGGNVIFGSIHEITAGGEGKKKKKNGLRLTKVNFYSTPAVLCDLLYILYCDCFVL